MTKEQKNEIDENEIGGNVFCDMERQVQMARALKAGVNGVHKPIKKTRTRLWAIFHPEHNKPHR